MHSLYAFTWMYNPIQSSRKIVFKLESFVSTYFKTATKMAYPKKLSVRKCLKQNEDPIIVF